MRSGLSGRASPWGSAAVARGVAVAVILACLPWGGSVLGANRMSLTLEEAVGIALERNNGLAIARADEGAAEARLNQARAAFFPRVTGGASYTKLDEVPYMDASQFGSIFEPLRAPFDDLVDKGYLDPETLEGLSGEGIDRIYMGDDDVYSVSLTVTQPIFTGGMLLGSYGAAKQAARAESWMRERVEGLTVYDVTEAYVNLISARASLGVMERSLEQIRSHVSDLAIMFEQGMILESDLMMGRVQASNAELARNRAEHGVMLAGATLAFLIGVDVDTEIVPVEELQPRALEDSDIETWTRVALRERPDLKAMAASSEAAGKGVMIARSGYMPSLVAIGSYNWDRPNREYEPEFYDSWSVTLALEMDIFDWGGRWNRVQEAKQRKLRADEGLTATEDAVRLDVKRGYLKHDEALRAVEIAREAEEQAAEAQRITRESFKNGMSTNSEVLDAQRALTLAQMQRIDAMSSLRLAEARLELAAGVYQR